MNECHVPGGRPEGGQFDFKPCGAGPHGFESAQSSEHGGEAALRAHLASTEDAIRNRATEVGLAFDADGNKVFERSDNSTNSIDMPDDTPGLKDTVFTHNHPVNSAFSPEDVLCGIKFDMAEVRATTRDGTYSMKRVGKWPPFDYMRWIIPAADATVYVENQRALKEGHLTIEQANRSHWRAVWQRLLPEVNQKFASTGAGMQFSFEAR